MKDRIQHIGWWGPPKHNKQQKVTKRVIMRDYWVLIEVAGMLRILGNTFQDSVPWKPGCDICIGFAA